ncbi:MAG: hypothetical protein HN846_04195 [Candidatus Pacebacteria bacterium]|jgi:hypothetical protein|nr:hypothetical protein [Candidatus Paceibacterota bacterium]MBT3511907.1 hypothetical protein [Candidatus Paceibacterota bacterium]MBT4005229.1 hypothetical protein [Candidatus Paceibacterota bacterium]MBT4358949.1 hypothetical protein [Candidatus Paceibacterota bacterium]MBT4680486.1 hypothetical protein [Candidatus Paceibacterota bacterium]
MNNSGNLTPPGNSSKKNQSSSNPFARALAESEKSVFADKKPQDEKNNLFGEALARAGGQIPQESNPEDLEKKQADLKKEQKKAELRKKLHDQVNPVDQKDIFSANKERTKKELEEVRKELKILAREISKFYKEVDIQTTQGITTQGTEGTGLKSYFQNLKAFIMLLTQKVKSARTWMRAQKSKQQRMKGRKIKGGMSVDGSSAEQGKTVFDMMHQERSTAYSGA